jgi:hypothetical protein
LHAALLRGRGDDEFRHRLFVLAAVSNAVSNPAVGLKLDAF